MRFHPLLALAALATAIPFPDAAQPAMIKNPDPLAPHFEYPDLAKRATIRKSIWGKPPKRPTKPCKGKLVLMVPKWSRFPDYTTLWACKDQNYKPRDWRTPEEAKKQYRAAAKKYVPLSRREEDVLAEDAFGEVEAALFGDESEGADESEGEGELVKRVTLKCRPGQVLLWNRKRPKEPAFCKPESLNGKKGYITLTKARLEWKRAKAAKAAKKGGKRDVEDLEGEVEGEGEDGLEDAVSGLEERDARGSLTNARKAARARKNRAKANARKAKQDAEAAAAAAAV